MAYTYVLFDGELYKIGYTENVAKRKAQLEKQYQKTLELVKCIEVDWANALEAELHYVFHHKRVFKEWFDLDGEDFEFMDKFVQYRVKNKCLNLSDEARKQLEHYGYVIDRIRKNDALVPYGSTGNPSLSRLVPNTKAFIGGLPVLIWWELHKGEPRRCISLLNT